MTTIYFERTGGLMGRKVSVKIDMDDLPEEQAELLENLMDEADFFELPNDMTRSAIPDGFTYDITICSDEREHSVRVGDTTAPDDLRPLLEELSRWTRTQR